jgi:large subunit ribosomal protein L10
MGIFYLSLSIGRDFLKILKNKKRGLMALSREKKEKLYKDLQDKLSKSKIAILVNYSGLKTPQIFDLKDNLEKHESSFQIIKNTLARKACENLQFNLNPDIFTGTLAIAYGFSDEVETTKILHQFSKSEEKPKILGAIYEKKWIDGQLVEKIAKIPDRKTLEAQLVGTIAAPISNLVYVLQGNLSGLISILSQVSKQKTVNS